jgi:hypothetical protein
MNGVAPRVGLALVAEEAFRVATTPLFEAGLVDALEWAVDRRFGRGDAHERVPRWAERLIDLYAEDDALYGHGVWFSLLSLPWHRRQDRWLACLAAECRRRRYRHVSEHFGFMASEGVAENTFMPLPHTPASEALGAERLGQIAEAAGTRVGLENAAVALGPADATAQAAFLEAVLAPVDGFLLLDVHNVFTQAVNLDLDPQDLLDTFVGPRVRELHISGGQWYPLAAMPAAPSVRLDGHDGPMPDEALGLLGRALAACPNVEVVIYERRDETLHSPADAEAIRNEFMAVRAVVEAVHG